MIHGDPTSAEIVWLEVTQRPGDRPERHGTVWPNGYSARFAPDLELLDRDGRVIAHEGSLLKDVDVCLHESGRLRVVSIGEVVG